MTSQPPPSLLSCDVEQRDGILRIRMRDTMAHSLEAHWWTEITTHCKGPFQGLWIDLFHCPVVSSSFIAGALQILDHFRNDQLQVAYLLNTSDRIARLIDIMNLSEYFIIKQHGGHGESSPL